MSDHNWTFPGSGLAICGTCGVTADQEDTHCAPVSRDTPRPEERKCRHGHYLGCCPVQNCGRESPTPRAEAVQEARELAELRHRDYFRRCGHSEKLIPGFAKAEVDDLIAAVREEERAKIATECPHCGGKRV